MQFDSHKEISESEGPHANNESGTGKLKCSSAFCTPNYHVKWISHYIHDARIHLGSCRVAEFCTYKTAFAFISEAFEFTMSVLLLRILLT